MTSSDQNINNVCISQAEIDAVPGIETSEQRSSFDQLAPVANANVRYKFDQKFEMSLNDSDLHVPPQLMQETIQSTMPYDDTEVADNNQSSTHPTNEYNYEYILGENDSLKMRVRELSEENQFLKNNQRVLEQQILSLQDNFNQLLQQMQHMSNK